MSRRDELRHGTPKPPRPRQIRVPAVPPCPEIAEISECGEYRVGPQLALKFVSQARPGRGVDARPGGPSKSEIVGVETDDFCLRPPPSGFVRDRRYLVCPSPWTSASLFRPPSLTSWGPFCRAAPQHAPELRVCRDLFLRSWSAAAVGDYSSTAPLEPPSPRARRPASLAGGTR